MVNRKLLLKYSPDLRIIIVAVLYYVSAWLGYLLSFQDATALPVWPPSGVAFALMILLGRRVWPGITIGSLIANIMAYWSHVALSAQLLISVSTFIALGNTLEALAGYFLINHWIRERYPFRSTHDAFRFLFVTMLMCTIGAFTGTISLYVNGVISASDVLQAGFSGWVQNMVGILLFTPFILAVFRKKYDIVFTTEKFIEVALFLAAIVSVFFLSRIDYLHGTIERALPFVILPFLLWLAFRFDLIVAMTGVLMAALFSLYLTVQSTGPFVMVGSYDSMLLLQIFIGVISISTIILSATVIERVVAQRELEQFNGNLEAMVLERTKALNEEINIRKNAEDKLKQANQELSKRNTELDNFVYSVSHDLRAPIASVLGLINLARKDGDMAMKNTYLDMINNSALQQDHFIKEILDQSRNSRLDVKREEVFFQQLIDETFDQLKFATTTGKTVQRIVYVEQERPFYCDRWRLKVILNNIISNSIRYRNGKDPLIKVNVWVETNSAKLLIEDNGRGIEKHHLKNIYKMFYRATDDGAGSGLGLYIVKEAIDKLNGFIEINSEAGKGTIVSLEVPEVGELIREGQPI